MEIQLSIVIDRPVLEVFGFMSDMANHTVEEGTKVLLVEKTTHGAIGLGTRFREVVQMLPLLRVEMINEITRFEPDESIEIAWNGGGMEGLLAFDFESKNGSTMLTMSETIHPKGIMNWIKPILQQNFHRMWTDRLNEIKRKLESS